MIHNDKELDVTKERIGYFQQQVEKLRQVETNPSGAAGENDVGHAWPPNVI